MRIRFTQPPRFSLSPYLFLSLWPLRLCGLLFIRVNPVETILDKNVVFSMLNQSYPNYILEFFSVTFVSGSLLFVKTCPWPVELKILNLQISNKAQKYCQVRISKEFNSSNCYGNKHFEQENKKIFLRWDCKKSDKTHKCVKQKVYMTQSYLLKLLNLLGSLIHLWHLCQVVPIIHHVNPIETKNAFPGIFCQKRRL